MDNIQSKESGGDYREDLMEIIDFWEDEDTARDEDVGEFTTNFKEHLEYVKEFKLYRFVPADYYNIRNIKKQTIHLSYNGVLNDIYEGLPILDNKMTADLHKEWNDLACMTCFSESKDNLLMWSYYADSSRGICIEYDIKRAVNDEIINHLYPVCYSSKRFIMRNVDGIIEEMRDLRNDIYANNEHDDAGYLQDILSMFLIKGESWEYEKEWRIIYSKIQVYDMDDDSLNNQIIDFPYISAVYMGFNIDKAIREDIQEIVETINNRQEHKIKLYESYLDKTEYKLNFSEIQV